MQTYEPYPLIGDAAFVIGERTYFWEDVHLAGLVWGEWVALQNELRRGEISLDRARAENALPTREEVEVAATRFRYEHNLISAQEAREWLARWRLGDADWIAYLRRSIVRDRFAEEGDTGEPLELPSAVPLVRELHAEAVCSGMLERLCREVAFRAACLALDEASAGREPEEPDWGDDASRWTDDSVLVTACRLGLPPLRSRERLACLASSDRSYSAHRARTLTPMAVAREIDVHRMEWTRIACDSLSFDNEGAAREAVLCMRVDHVPLRDVALAARRQATEELFYLDDKSAIAEQLKGACVGDALGPVGRGARFIVLEVQGKIAPTSDDDEIRRRAESSIMRGFADRELAPMIRWPKTF